MSDRPVIYRIPFSHYCQKAEWGLTQAGIPYDCVDISLPKMVRLPDVTATGLVPAMVTDGRLIEGSDRILHWASDHAGTDTDPLYPSGVEDTVREWESWAGEVVGTVSRREAYRVAYNDPWHFTRNPFVRVAVRAARPIVLGVLKYYKMRRYDEQDREAVPQIIERIADGLRTNGTGYLVTDRPTAADHAVAALARPLLYAEPGRDYADLEGWELTKDYIEGMRPRKVLRKRSRRIRGRDWDLLADLSSGSA